MTHERYGRAVSVTIADLTPTTTTEPNALVLTKFRVAFAIEKSLGKSPNTCTVSISNLRASTRADLQLRPRQLTLAAGYGTDLRRLFVGDIIHAPSGREGATLVTKIQVGDGMHAYANASYQKSYKPGATGVDPRDVLKDLAQSMNLQMPTSLPDALKLARGLSSGVTVSGPSAKSVDKIVKKYGLGWSVQDGALQILGDSDVLSNDAIVVSQATGMIDSPKYGAPKADGKPPSLDVKSLLLPEALPGGVVQLQSISINGFFKIAKVKHDGDTHGDDWTTTLEMEPR